MRSILLILIAFSFFLSSAQVKPVAFTLTDIAYPITNMKKDPRSTHMLISLTGGRFLYFDNSTGRLNEQSTPTWKNFSIEGFDLGGNALFSKDGKYILLTEKIPLYNFDKVQVKPYRAVVLEAASGKVVYSLDDVYSAQFINDSDKITGFKEDEIITYDLETAAKQSFKTPLGIETACISHSGNLLAISYDAGMEEFKSKQGAGYNRKEIKNALRNKKLIAFFEFPSMKKINVIKEEVDVVFSLEFTPDDQYLLFYSRTRQLEHQNTSLLNGLDKTRDLNQYQRIDLSNFKVDNQNFIYQTSEAQSNHELDPVSGLFVYGDNKGFLAAKREIVVVNFNKQQDYLGRYAFQGRSGTRNLYSTAFSIINDHTILVANGTKLSYWDFNSLAEYSEYVEPMNENALLDKAVEQLNNDLDKPDSKLSENIAKKNIRGIFIFNLTVQKSGEVVSIYTQSDDKTNINMQNMLKDLMMKYRFDISVPKNERIKFIYTFNL